MVETSCLTFDHGYNQIYVWERSLFLIAKSAFDASTTLNMQGKFVAPIEKLESHLLWNDIKQLKPSITKWPEPVNLIDRIYILNELYVRILESLPMVKNDKTINIESWSKLVAHTLRWKFITHVILPFLNNILDFEPHWIIHSQHIVPMIQLYEKSILEDINKSKVWNSNSLSTLYSHTYLNIAVKPVKGWYHDKIESYVWSLKKMSTEIIITELKSRFKISIE